jgi:hypothetical protein
MTGISQGNDADILFNSMGLEAVWTRYKYREQFRSTLDQPYHALRLPDWAASSIFPVISLDGKFLILCAAG